MNFIKAKEIDLEKIVQVVQNTIKEIYPKYYPQEVTDFFLAHHNWDNIEADIKKGNVWILLKDNVMVGTGSYEENHITRIYVCPAFQGNGYGSFIMGEIETKIQIKHSKIKLDASLPACHIYEKRGYFTVEHKNIHLDGGAVLVYDVMEMIFANNGTKDYV